MILIFAGVLASPSPAPDPCASLLAVLNRPSIGFAPCAVKRGQNVDEFGYQNGTVDGPHQSIYPQGFLRFGAARNLELDIIAPAGSLDSGFGAKYEFWHDDTRALAADFLYTVPTGAAAFTAGAPVATLNIDYSMPISSKLGIASTLGGQNARGIASLLPSVLVSDQWNPRAQVFVEAFGQTRLQPDGGSLFGTDAALQYLVTPHLEVDVEAGRTVTTMSRLHYVGFGFAYGTGL
jgi:hypothetical protein